MRELKELNTRIQFHGMVPNEGPEAGEGSSGVVYECWAGIDSFSVKDFDESTVENVTLFIRDPRGSFVPSNKHSISIMNPLYEGKLYNVKMAQPDFKNSQFINIATELTS